MLIALLAPILLRHGDTLVGIIPVIQDVQLAKVTVLADATRCFSLAVPLPMKFSAPRQGAAQDHVVVAVAVMLGLAGGIGGTHQLLLRVVNVVCYHRTGLPVGLCAVAAVITCL